MNKVEIGLISAFLAVSLIPSSTTQKSKLSNIVSPTPTVIQLYADTITNANVSVDLKIYQSSNFVTWNLFQDIGDNRQTIFTNSTDNLMFYNAKQTVIYDTNGTYNIRISWEPSTSPNIIGYKVYYGIQSGVYSGLVDAGNSTIATVSHLKVNHPYFFAVTSYDSNGESTFSNEISFIINSGVPITNGENIHIIKVSQ